MIKILFLAANPAGTNELQLDEESRAIDQALRMAAFRDSFDIRSHWAVRYADLPELLLRYQPDIVHFSGHGSPAGEIILDEGSGSHPVSARALGRLFAVLKDNIRCVVLNACFSQIQAEAIAEHIDCVVGMSKAISDTAAIDFAAAFYQGLGYGRSVQTAFDLACNRIDLANLAEQDTPQLLARRTNPRQVILADAASTDGAKSVAPDQMISTGGGVYVGGNVSTGGGDFTGRDKVVEGDEVRRDKVMGDKIGGDKTEGHISNLGPGAQAAIGKDIRQTITYAAPQLTSADIRQVKSLLADLKGEIASLDIPEDKKLIGEEFAGQLEQELTKQDEPPDASVIKVAGAWLLKNMPGLTGALTSLFLNPIVGKVVEAAGDLAADWVKKQFGG